MVHHSLDLSVTLDSQLLIIITADYAFHVNSTRIIYVFSNYIYDDIGKFGRNAVIGINF